MNKAEYMRSGACCNDFSIQCDIGHSLRRIADALEKIGEEDSE